jgi:hypothetical protein
MIICVTRQHKILKIYDTGIKDKNFPQKYLVKIFGAGGKILGGGTGAA